VILIKFLICLIDITESAVKSSQLDVTHNVCVLVYLQTVYQLHRLPNFKWQDDHKQVQKDVKGSNSADMYELFHCSVSEFCGGSPSAKLFSVAV
jgi:hypothetical protein